MGGAGLQHRQISVTDGALGLELSDDFTAAGYERKTITTMIYCGGPAGPAEHHVQAVSLKELRPALLRK